MVAFLECTLNMSYYSKSKIFILCNDPEFFAIICVLSMKKLMAERKLSPPDHMISRDMILKAGMSIWLPCQISLALFHQVEAL